LGKKKGGGRKRKKGGNKPSSYTKKAAKLKRNRGKTIQTVSKQKRVPTTARGRKLDAARKAKPPGWRVSKSGRLYFENRSNRSDRPGSKV